MRSQLHGLQVRRELVPYISEHLVAIPVATPADRPRRHSNAPGSKWTESHEDPVEPRGRQDGPRYD